MRVLIVLSDTDRSDSSLCALDLHAGIVALGDDVRTVALGPGGRGGLDHVIPILGPSPRSPSATLQLRREQRWADIVICFGLHTFGVQRRAAMRQEIPVVLVVGDPVSTRSRVGRSARTRLAEASSVVCVDEAAAAAVATMTDRQVMRLEFGMVAEELNGVALRRAAARAELRIGPTEPVLWWVGSPATQIPAALATATERRGWPVLMFGDADDELVVAASDVAVMSADAVSGPPRELLRAAGTGHALVAPAYVFDGALVSGATGVPLSPRHRSGSDTGDGARSDGTSVADWEDSLERLSDADVRAEMALSAHRLVSARFSPQRTFGPWMDLLESRLLAR